MRDGAEDHMRATLALSRVVRLEIEAGTPREVVLGALEAVRRGLDVEMRVEAAGGAGADAERVYRAGGARGGRRRG